MRPARLSLASFVLTTIPLVACTLDGDSSSSCYDDYSSYGCGGYDPYYGGSSSGDYGNGYDSGSSSSTDPSSSGCDDTFAVAFDAPASDGDCKLELSSYDVSYGSGAIYYFAAPFADQSVQCEALEGPTPGRCLRALDTIAFGSTSPADVDALRAALGLTGTTFSARLSCAHSANEPSKDVAITCVPKKPAGPQVGDAGATSDAGVSDDAATPTPDAGCGP